MRIGRIIAAATVILASAPTSAQDSTLGRAYLAALQSIWRSDASGSDVASLVSLLADSATYEHPRFGARIEGVGAIREAMMGFLGASRQPHISDVQMITGVGVQVLSFDLAMEVRQEAGWRRIERHQVIVLEIAEGRITRIADYW